MSIMLLLSCEQCYKAKRKKIRNKFSFPFISYCDLEVRIQFLIPLICR